MTVTVSLLTLIGIGLSAIARREMGPLAVWLAPKIARAAARRLPPRLADLKTREWVGEIESMEGIQFGRLVFAIGTYIAAQRMQGLPAIATELRVNLNPGNSFRLIFMGNVAVVEHPATQERSEVWLPSPAFVRPIDPTAWRLTGNDESEVRSLGLDPRAVELRIRRYLALVERMQLRY